MFSNILAERESRNTELRGNYDHSYYSLLLWLITFIDYDSSTIASSFHSSFEYCLCETHCRFFEIRSNFQIPATGYLVLTCLARGCSRHVKKIPYFESYTRN